MFKKKTKYEWFEETIHDEFTQRIRVDKRLYTAKSEYQKIEVFENALFGKVMLLDGAVQVTQSDEFFYHEMFAHVPLLSCESPKRVLIIGGGDGCLLRETLRHPTVETTMVEIDGMVVETSKVHLPELSQNAFENERAEVIIGDGLKYVEESKETFDVILIDSTDPDDISDNLFTTEFLKQAETLLNPEGVLVMQSGTPFFQREVYRHVKASFKEVFAHSGFFYSTIPTYSGGAHAFAWGSTRDLTELPEELIRNRYQKLPDHAVLKHYSPEMHEASYVESVYLQDL